MMQELESLDKPRDTQGVSEIYRDGTYLKKNKGWHVQDSPWKAQQILRMLKKNRLRPKSICEIGCGAGEILRQLSHDLPDVECVGYEVSPQAYELCKTRESKRLRFYLEDLLEEDVFYECLLCIDVFEHVEDYLGFIKRLRAKADYKLFHIPLDISVLSVLRGNLIRSRQDVGHLHYFTPESAIATLQDCGYEVIDKFFTTWFDGLPAPTLKAKLARMPRRILFNISQCWAVRLLGGCSYLVLAR